MLLGCLVSVLFGGLAGCVFPSESPISTVKVTAWCHQLQQGLDAHVSKERSLLLDKHGKKTLIWRYLSNQFLYTNDLALFHGLFDHRT